MQLTYYETSKPGDTNTLKYLILHPSTQGRPTFSIKRAITWSSNGSRIVTVADIDQDGNVDVVGMSYYDSSLRWFRNVPQIYNNEDDPDDPKNGSVEDIKFEENLISYAVNEGQVRA